MFNQLGYEFEIEKICHVKDKIVIFNITRRNISLIHSESTKS